jgi:hypothetical protein
MARGKVRIRTFFSCIWPLRLKEATYARVLTSLAPKRIVSTPCAISSYLPRRALASSDPIVASCVWRHQITSLRACVAAAAAHAKGPAQGRECGAYTVLSLSSPSRVCEA